MTVRSKKYELNTDDTRQIKIADIEAPIRFEVGSGTFTYQVKVEEQLIGSPAAIASGVLVAPGGAWGSEIVITCTSAGTLYAVHVG